MYIVEAAPRDAQEHCDRWQDGGLYRLRIVVPPVHRHVYDPQRSALQLAYLLVANRDRPVPDAKVAIYPFKRVFVVGAVSTDVQTGLATMCYLPGIETPERECWYINMGAVDKSFFTTEAMVQAAQ